MSTDKTTDDACKVIADLLACMDAWERQNLNSVAAGLAFLRRHARPELFLNAAVIDMMEKQP